MHTDHSALRFLKAKNDVNPTLIGWVILLKKFDFDVKYRKRTENHVANHFSILEDEDMRELGEKA